MREKIWEMKIHFVDVCQEQKYNSPKIHLPNMFLFSEDEKLNIL